VNKLSELTIRIFDAEVGFPLLRVAASVPKARKAAEITSACKTAEGGELELRFAGPISEVRPITEFLEPQLRAATEPGAEVSLTLSFPEGLTLDGTDPEKLTERLSRFVSGSAHVTARALEKGD